MKKNNFIYWVCTAGIKALKAFAQTAMTTISMTGIMSEIDWAIVVFTSILSAAVSLLSSVEDLLELSSNDDSDIFDFTNEDN